MTYDRLRGLDMLRGIAVMAILLMNIVSFGMPEAAYISPAAWGGLAVPDLAAWLFSWLFVESKARGLFTIMFGASLLLYRARSEDAGRDAQRLLRRRLLWLLAIGVAHYLLIWEGDILMLYAVCGLLALPFLEMDQARLAHWTKGWLVAGFGVAAALAIGVHIDGHAALQAGASAETIRAADDFRREMLGDPGFLAGELALNRGGYDGLFLDRLSELGTWPLLLVVTLGAETLGLMALGMLLLRNGFLTLAWSDAEYWRVARLAYLLGLPPLLVQALWLWITGWDPWWTMATQFGWAYPFRLAVTVGHAALAMILIRRFMGSRLMARVEAAGQAALSNYIGTSLAMTGLFYGYGLGWFGSLSRAQLYLVVPVAWAAMLLWSKPWLARFRHGPLEWLWRSLTLGEPQPFRRRPS